MAFTDSSYLSLDPQNDMHWPNFQGTHEDDDRSWQGPKASEGLLAKKELLRKFYAAHEHTKKMNWKGDKRWTYIEKKCGLSPNTDRGTLRRLRRQADDLCEEENGW